MSSERLWILILAATTFCAGLAGGILLALRWQPAPAARAFQAYERRMIETFDLDDERQRNLHYILDSYRDEIEGLKEESVAALEPELVRQGQRHRELIRTWVVPEHRRQEFDLWASGLPARESRPERTE
jgi:hypothetical protein